MSNKDKEISKSKFKHFLKNAKTSGTAAERALRPEIEMELRPEHPAAQRCKTLKEIGEQQLCNLNLEEAYITKLWELTQDLIVPNKLAEYRQTALTFYKKLIYSQYKNLTHMREHFFLVIQNHDVREDLRHRLELLDTLTENGKDISNFEEKIGRFMLSWIETITDPSLLSLYLAILVNIIKFNAAHLDNDTVIGIIEIACQLSSTNEDDAIGLQCLTILETVICYAIFPSDPLTLCVVTLCRTVNYQPYWQASWKIMKILLGTQLGYHSMQLMCNILNDPNYYEEQHLIRGAVFHLNMSVFGYNVIFQVPSTFYATTVLTSFLHALDSRKVIVTYEVILSARKVINRYKTELSEILWDRICDIMSSIVDNIKYYEYINIDVERLQHLQINFHETIDCIEKLLQDEQTLILGNIDRIYSIIERVCEYRSEASVLQLIEYRSSQITATHPEWLKALNEFVGRFYRIPNTSIRIKTIQCLMKIMDLNRSCYEEEILERIVIPHFSYIIHETDLQIRTEVAKALIDFTRHSDTKRCGEILDILEKIINRPFELYQQQLQQSQQQYGNNIADGALNTINQIGIGGIIIKHETEIQDIITAVDGLIEIFVIKLYRYPPCHAIKIFNILLGHLEQHYERPKIFEQANTVRYKIFNWVLKARANATYHIGYPDPINNDAIKFSHYLGIDTNLPAMPHQNSRHTIATQTNAVVTAATHDINTPSTHLSTISIRRICKIIVKCLECDHDYQIFQLVIKELPKILQNKALIQGSEIEELAVPLLKICNDGGKSLNITHNLSTDGFHALLLPAIASLVTYHQSIPLQKQYNIISLLLLGIFSGTANVCINAMTTVILEMPETLHKTLPDILLKMSKMSNTSILAKPVLEFLSILSRLSNQLFTNFTPREYMCIFGITLKYTQPKTYDHYTVSLAHHVIAGWFLKSRLEYRRGLVGRIIPAIQSNTSLLNEDSSNRKRSTSLTERGSRNTQTTRNDSELGPPMDENLKRFHAELVETCIDFLARHTFSLCLALPKRLPAVEYLLMDGTSQTWLVGHNLVTITTSGCPFQPFPPTRDGLCERCAQLCKTTHAMGTKSSSDSSSTAPLSPEIITNLQQQSVTAERRYTKVSLQHSSGNESAGSTDLTSSSSSSAATAAAHGGVAQRQTSNSSTASLEALSRRGSNPEAAGSGANSTATTADIASGSGIGVTSGSSTSLLGNSLSTASVSAASPTQLQQSMTQQTCLRSCTGWAEVLIRRPTGNISWITRIQNPIANECFAQDMPLSNIVSLFLPKLYGGVFGPDFVQSSLTQLNDNGDVEEELPVPNAALGNMQASTTNLSSSAVAQPPQTNRDSREFVTTATSTDPSVALDEHRCTAALSKARALRRQKEISASTAASTAAIDIPKTTSKRGKDTLSGSVSDGEADDDTTAAFYDDPTSSRARNPVRRVNSSPEMSSSWRYTFLASKPPPLSREATVKSDSKPIVDESNVVGNESLQPQQQQQLQNQKKKSVQYTKDMRVSCEAIPEEVAGSTPPQTQSEANTAIVAGGGVSIVKTASADAPTHTELSAFAALPPKQHSADDVTSSGNAIQQQQHQQQQQQQQAPTVQLFASQTSLKMLATKIAPNKPPLSPAPPQSPRLDKHITNVPPLATNFSTPQKTTSFSSPARPPLHQGLAKSSSSGSGNGSSVTAATLGADFNNGGDMMRGRSKTISVVREVNGKTLPPTTSSLHSFAGSKPQVKPLHESKRCMNPSFVFMQLYHTGQIQVTDVPIKVPQEHMKSIALLDLTPPFETHNIGVLYVGQGQCNNALEILRNSYGSTRYVKFLSSIGTLVSLKDSAQKNLFLCLDTSGDDGKFTYVWKDDTVQITFHVATLMPTNLKKDPNCNEKKKHIGNDFVHIVYNESGEDYNLNTISGQFSYACVIVEPLELNTNRVYVKARPEIAKFVCHPEPKIVSDRSAPLLARQFALHANLASLVFRSGQEKNPYASNWLERLRIIKRLRTKLMESEPHQQQGGSSSTKMNSATSIDGHANRDFTNYT